MNTPRTAKIAIEVENEKKSDMAAYISMLIHARQLEAEVQELRNQLEELLDCAEGRAPLTVGTCNAARAILARTGGK